MLILLSLNIQGINEQQTVAIKRNECRLQEDINKENMFRIKYYWEMYRGMQIFFNFL
jgi:hypothetical protein